MIRRSAHRPVIGRPRPRASCKARRRAVLYNICTEHPASHSCQSGTSALPLDLLARPRSFPIPAQLDSPRVPTIGYPTLLLQLRIRQLRQIRVERPYRLYDEVK